MKPLVDGMTVELMLDEVGELSHDETGENGAEVIIGAGFFGRSPYKCRWIPTASGHVFMQSGGGDAPKKGDLNRDALLAPADAAVALRLTTGRSACNNN